MQNLDRLIGNTPIIKINYKYKDKIDSIYCKLEFYNLTGSIKDRMAYYIVKNAIKSHDLKENMPIIEATSGNTGISFAAIGAILKCPVHIFIPDWISKERIELLKMYGANIHLVSKKDGGFKTAIKEADKLARKIHGFRPNQFKNKLNIEAHYQTTGNEILHQINNIGGFISGIGTGGSLIGIGKKLKEYNPKIKVIALEPSTLPLLSTGKTKGSHKIEGIGDDFIPEIVDKKIIDDIILIDDNDAINMARKIAKNIGVGVGISSGANLLGAIIIKETIQNNIITLFVDDNKKYLTTDLSLPIDNNPNYISNQIELLNFE